MKNVIAILICFSLCSCSEEANNTENMILVPSGYFQFGSNDGKEHEKPEVQLFMPSFYLDQHEVTNSDFQKFVEAKNYITDAEKTGSSMIYTSKWEIVEHVSWNQFPYGEEKKPQDFNQLPVVHVSWNDAKAYCEWKNKRLPTEQEMEYVIESFGTSGQNIWEGSYPDKNTKNDGYHFTAPVMSYQPNELGIYDLKGNVWEWTADNYNYNLHNILSVKNKDTASAWLGNAYDPTIENSGTLQKVIKGGSFLCHKSYCEGYKAAAKMAAEPKNTYFHVGFRCACDQ